MSLRQDTKEKEEEDYQVYEDEVDPDSFDAEPEPTVEEEPKPKQKRTRKAKAPVEEVTEKDEEPVVPNKLVAAILDNVAPETNNPYLMGEPMTSYGAAEIVNAILSGVEPETAKLLTSVPEAAIEDRLKTYIYIGKALAFAELERSIEAIKFIMGE
jgi:hypothetical protein